MRARLAKKIWLASMWRPEETYWFSHGWRQLKKDGKIDHRIRKALIIYRGRWTRKRFPKILNIYKNGGKIS